MRSFKSILGLMIVLQLILALVGNTVFAQRKVSEEALLFKALRQGVVTVFGDEGHGSGFLIQEAGILLTNQHVIANSAHIRVLINDSLCVPAKLLVSDDKSDIAAILVNPLAVIGLPVLRISQDQENFAIEGERVMAIGSPLNQSQVLTTGVISKVEERVIISDVNINHGNSGGPLINMDGNVIGINTFGDFSSQGGPGISGIIRIDVASKLIARAIDVAKSTTPPPLRKFPVMPNDSYPLWALEIAAKQEKYDAKPYNLSVGGFNIQVFSPPFSYWSEKKYELQLAKKRKEREKKGKASQEESYNPYEDLKNWYQYLGKYRPVVVINIIPRFGETSGSFWRNLIGAVAAGASGSYYYGSHKYEFKADLKEFYITVNGDTALDIQRGMTYEPLDFYFASLGSAYRGEDLARAGTFVFPYEIFSPRNGVWPQIRLHIFRIDNPSKPEVLLLPQKTVERIWLDFEPYLETLESRKIKLYLGE